jgi:hypothetical protein
LLLPLLLTACAAGPDAGDPAAGPSSGAAPASSPSAVDGVSLPGEGDAVMISLDAGDGGDPAVYTLVCTPPFVGSLPDGDAACALLRSMPDPFAALPADQVCTEQYGGPQTARITGRWGGEPVDLALARTNGCEIAQWDGLAAVLPMDVG